jgi:hypothetical protein
MRIDKPILLEAVESEVYFMFGAEQQKKEIETIREKKISVRLSEADCERVSRLCGEHNITVGELLENFIGDLVDGTYTNGGDERMYARNYFERCSFGMLPETTLLNWLLSSCQYDVDDLYDLLDSIKDGYEEIEYSKTNPEEFGEEEIGFLKTNIKEWENELAEIKAEYLKANDKADWEEETEKVKQWYEEMERMRNE